MGLCMEVWFISPLSYYKNVVFHIFERRLSSNAYEKCEIQNIEKRNNVKKKQILLLLISEKVLNDLISLLFPYHNIKIWTKKRLNTGMSFFIFY